MHISFFYSRRAHARWDFFVFEVIYRGEALNSSSECMHQLKSWTSLFALIKRIEADSICRHCWALDLLSLPIWLRERCVCMICSVDRSYQDYRTRIRMACKSVGRSIWIGNIAYVWWWAKACGQMRISIPESSRQFCWGLGRYDSSVKCMRSTQCYFEWL